MTEGFTKEVLMMWKALVVAGGRCTALKAGKKGIRIEMTDSTFYWQDQSLFLVLCRSSVKYFSYFPFSSDFSFFPPPPRGDRRFEKPGRKDPGWFTFCCSTNQYMTFFCLFVCLFVCLASALTYLLVSLCEHSRSCSRTFSDQSQ